MGYDSPYRYLGLFGDLTSCTTNSLGIHIATWFFGPYHRSFKGGILVCCGFPCIFLGLLLLIVRCCVLSKCPGLRSWAWGTTKPAAWGLCFGNVSGDWETFRPGFVIVHGPALRNITATDINDTGLSQCIDLGLRFSGSREIRFYFDTRVSA